MTVNQDDQNGFRFGSVRRNTSWSMPGHSVHSGTRILRAGNFTNSLSHTFLGDDLTRTSEVNPVFSCSTVGEPALSFCVCEGRRELRAVQRHISHGYLVNPSAVHWRARFCTCGDQRL